MQNKVVILGLGFVGQANAVALTRMGYEIWAQDIVKVNNIYAADDFDKINIFTDVSDLPFKPADKVPVMVCVNAHNGGCGQNLEPARAALAKARKITRGLVIVRTTIMPKHLQCLDFDLYLPEFLHERSALQEVQFPEMLVWGFKNRRFTEADLPDFILEWRDFVQSKPNGKVFRGSAEEGAYIKYLMNIWNAMRIGFVNEFGRAVICDDLGADHDQIIDFVMDRAFYLRYGKAFGGHCLPKDTEGFFAEHGHMKLLKGLIDSNREHLEFEKVDAGAQELFYGED
jgi:UDP-glucose 6-dehydrogenase